MTPNMKSQLTIGYIGISIVTIIVLSLLYIKCRDKEKFCTCQGLDRQHYSDPSVTQAEYRSGKVTEYSDLVRGAPYDYMAKQTQFKPYRSTSSTN